MQTTSNSEFISGTFIRELKNRFLCEVNILGENVVCYVPSSCHLSNFLDLKGREVVLVQTKSKNARTKYSLYAAPYKHNYIILNASLANRAVEKSIHSRIFGRLGKRSSVLFEHSIDGYKADLYIEDTKTIVEIKSILSIDEIALFPTVYSERSIKQLQILKSLKMSGYSVCYLIISLNPYIKQINVLSGTSWWQAMQKCMNLGMNFFAFSCRIKDNELQISKSIPIIFDRER